MAAAQVTTAGPTRRQVVITRLGWVAMAVPTLYRLVFGWATAHGTRFDFRIYYLSLRSPSLYDFSWPDRLNRRGYPFTYPPIAAVFMTPFRWVAERPAEFLWILTSIIAATVALYLVLREVAADHDMPTTWVPWLVAAGLWMIPVTRTVNLGQINEFVVLPIVIDLVLLRRKSRWAGIGIGFAAALKLTPLVFIPVLLFNRPLRRSGWTALVSALAFTALASALRWHDTVRYWTKELVATDRVGALDSRLSGAVRRFTVWIPGPSSLGTLVWLVASVALLALVMAASRRLVADGQLADLVVVVGVMACVISPITWSHHMFFALPALVITVLRFPNRWVWALVGVAAFVFVDLERGKGPYFTGLQGLFMAVFVVAVCVQVLVERPAPAQR